ncbi:MAG: polysaccharide pyruvyl transferase family protein [Propionibacteriaceae bacterium]|nr:polysaccharide pyruvyl transferase family protein [Propionibacteriaceae bacterium]
MISLNAGNYFYWDSVFRWVSVPGATVVPDSLLSQTFHWSKRYAEMINSEFDAYVFTLTNSFRKDFVDGLDAWTDLLRKLKLPVVGVGGGVQLGWKDGLEPGPRVDEATKRFVSELLNHSATISVRGHTTAAYLKRLGFGDHVVHVTGCPSLYLYGPDYQIRAKGELTKESKVAMNVAVRDYGFADFLNQTYADYPNFIYIAQTGDDLATFVWGKDRLVDIKPEFPVHLDHPILRDGKARMFLDTRTWVDFLRDYDYMAGTRIHGTVAAILAGVPSTLVSMDQRTHELGEFHRIPTFRRPDLADDETLASLYAKSDWTAFNAALPELYQNFCDFFDENGIEHIGQPGKANPEYDEQIRAAKLPGPITPIMTHGQLDQKAVLARLNWLREGIDETLLCEKRGYFAPEFPAVPKAARAKQTQRYRPPRTLFEKLRSRLKRLLRR